MAGTAALPNKSLRHSPPFAHTWVGGDIHGLAAFAGALYGYVPGMEDVVTALNKQVSEIVGDAGWQGAAATAFTGNWEKVSAEANAVGLVVIQAGSIVDQLAVELAKIENALERAADQAAAHGVEIGGNGQPPEACYASQTQEDWRLGYGSFYRRCLAAAQGARVQARAPAEAYGAMVSARGKPGSSSDLGPKIDEGSTLADYLADLLAAPTVYANQVAGKVAELGQQAVGAKQAWLEAQAAARQANGQFGVMPDEVKQALKDANAELASESEILTQAEDGENAFSEVFGARLSDLPGVSKLADGFADGSMLLRDGGRPARRRRRRRGPGHRAQRPAGHRPWRAALAGLPARNRRHRGQHRRGQRRSPGWSPARWPGCPSRARPCSAWRPAPRPPGWSPTASAITFITTSRTSAPSGTSTGRRASSPTSARPGWAPGTIRSNSLGISAMRPVMSGTASPWGSRPGGADGAVRPGSAPNSPPGRRCCCAPTPGSAARRRAAVRPQVRYRRCAAGWSSATVCC